MTSPALYPWEPPLNERLENVRQGLHVVNKVEALGRILASMGVATKLVSSVGLQDDMGNCPCIDKLLVWID